MALTENERRALAQMEAAFYAEDPKLASKLAGGGSRLPVPQLILAGVGLVLGLVALIIGLSVHPAVSVAGFVVMFVASVFAVVTLSRGDVLDRLRRKSDS